MFRIYHKEIFLFAKGAKAIKLGRSIYKTNIVILAEKILKKKKKNAIISTGYLVLADTLTWRDL
mgnify:CR=1 FL=1